ncbi:MAG: hypothetical protein WAQ52_13080 [Terriglobales bacterium]
MRRDGDILASSCDTDQFAKKRYGGKHPILARHGITTRKKPGRLALTKKTMQEEAPIPRSEHNFAAANVFGRTGGNLRDVAGPKRREHAFAANLQAQPAGAAQSLNC